MTGARVMTCGDIGSQLETLILRVPQLENSRDLELYYHHHTTGYSKDHSQQNLRTVMQ
jgi:hypothetical protein